MSELTAALIAAGVRAADPVISPDGRWVAWTTSSAGEPGQRISELWLAPVGRDAAPVKGEKGRFPRWSPDSGSLLYVAEEGLRRLRIGADGPATEAETVLPWRGEISELAPLAGGRLVAVVAADEMTDEDERQPWRWHRLRVLDLDSGELRVVAGLAGRHVTGVAQRPDGGALAVMSWDCPDYDPGVFTARLHIADPGDGTATDLCEVGLEAGSPAWWRASDGWHVSWLEALQPVYASAAFDVAVSAGHPEDLTADLAACPDVLAQVSDDAATIAVVASTAYAPPDVSAGPPDALTRISDTRPELRGISLGTQERLSWRAPDGLELEGVLVLPPRRGRAFADQVGRALGQDEWTDILAGIDVLVAEGVADPDRLGIAGWSHGGFMAAWAVTQTDRFRAAVMGAGIADWAIQVAVGEFGRAEAGLCGSYGWEGTGPHLHDRLSPISYAKKVSTPVLILHGENDTNVPASQATYFHRALLDSGAEHDMVIYPRENHGITERAHQIDVLERVRSWFTRWLPVPPAPPQQ